MNMLFNKQHNVLVNTEKIIKVLGKMSKWKALGLTCLVKVLVPCD